MKGEEEAKKEWFKVSNFHPSHSSLSINIAHVLIENYVRRQCAREKAV
jgi:hypothetical protein